MTAEHVMTGAEALQFVSDYKDAEASGWRLLRAEGPEYPPRAFRYRGGMYRYVLDDGSTLPISAQTPEKESN